nr:hypothetical protein WS66_11685 [Burkholderia sp. LA-2-3-30-S1-D2]
MSENTDQSGGGSPFSDDAENEVVRQAGRTDKDGASVGHFTLTPASDTRTKELLCDVRPIIPVIFLPGVMGSPLVNAETGDEMFFERWPRSFGQFSESFKWTVQGDHAADLIAGSVAKYASSGV